MSQLEGELWCPACHGTGEQALGQLHFVEALKKKQKKFTYFHNISDLFSKMAGEAIAVECSTALERR